MTGCMHVSSGFRGADGAGDRRRVRCVRSVRISPLFGVAIALGLQGWATPAVAQRDVPLFGVKDAVLTTTALGIWSVPLLTDWDQRIPGCGPCDAGRVPFFDRWVIHEPIASVDGASDVALGAVLLVSFLDAGLSGGNGGAAFVASVESFLWARAVTDLLKEATGRKRPVLYTDLASEVAELGTNQRSFPSGHTSAAFAAATSYWLSRRHLLADDKPWLRWTLMGVAAGVGVLRVAAGKHYPSDVVFGAAVGVGSAVLVHTIKF